MATHTWSFLSSLNLATICSTEYFFARIEHLQLVSGHFWEEMDQSLGGGQFVVRIVVLSRPSSTPSSSPVCLSEAASFAT
jgi:hypothetical protein